MLEKPFLYRVEDDPIYQRRMVFEFNVQDADLFIDTISPVLNKESVLLRLLPKGGELWRIKWSVALEGAPTKVMLARPEIKEWAASVSMSALILEIALEKIRLRDSFSLDDLGALAQFSNLNIAFESK